MKILLNNNDLNEALYGVSNLGFVPTMGCLHNGHISLIKKSLKKCNKTLVSIFVNPTQFNNKRDFRNYPRNNNKDLSILKKLKVDFVYLPRKKHVYSSERKSKIKLDIKDKILCAKYRKGHFEGVIDVVDRLIDIIEPKIIFMGEKDFQQLYLVRKYISNNFKTQIVASKTVRNKNKLALSSRNSLLNIDELTKAEKFSKSLILLKRKLLKNNNINTVLTNKKKELSSLFGILIDYLELRNIYNLKKSNKTKNSKLFVAYHINKVRLIDNF